MLSPDASKYLDSLDDKTGQEYQEAP